MRFGTSTSDGDLGCIAAKPLLLHMKASILTSGTAKFAVILGQQVRAPFMVASLTPVDCLFLTFILTNEVFADV